MSESIPQRELRELAQVVQDFTPLLPEVEATGQVLLRCLENGGKVLSCGNGGSATDALHLAEELVGRYRSERRPLPALCLAADISAMTCIANDYGYEQVFSRAVEALGQPGDVLVGFSTSGNSANVRQAFEVAKARQVQTILLTGADGGAIAGLADHTLRVPSKNTARIQELHTFILHVWLEMIEGRSW